jgi:hypothetical protein
LSQSYLNYAGWITLPRPPFNADHAEFYSFGFRADMQACQRFLDKTYNVIAGQQRFRMLLDVVFLAYVKNPAIIATTPPFSNQGGMPEIDIGFWLLVGSFDDGAILPSKVAWVPAYLFVDSGLAVAVGREIMGYPKYFSNIVAPAGSPSTGPFVASAMLIEEFDPNAIAKQQQFLALNGKHVVATPLDSSTSAAEVFAQIIAGASPEHLKPFAEGRYGADFLPAPGIPVTVWYLKQFRTADGSDNAVYQGLIKGPLTLRTLREMKILKGEWTLEVGAFDSLPFIEDLGLGTPDKHGKVTLTTKVGFWASCDYTSGTAVPLV